MAQVAKQLDLFNNNFMKFRRLISVFMLLLAVWFPLDNALAGAVVQGCPMMSHAFERGLHKTFLPKAAQSTHGDQPSGQHCQMTMQTTSGTAEPFGLAHSTNTCTHCSLCLLLGSVALNLSHPQVNVVPVPSEKITAFLSASCSFKRAPLFRPPII